MYQIKNEFFCLKLSETGAELEQFFIHGINILWKKNDLWNRQSPILFPNIGQVKDGYYIYENKKYSLPSHGFIKDEIFEVVQLNTDYIKLKTRYNEKTLQMFPFKFEFSVSYRLMKNKVKILFEVINLDDKLMYFSCGFHPGFSFDGLNQLFLEDYQFEFTNDRVKAIEFDPCFVDSIKEKNIQRIQSISNFSSKMVETKTLCYEGLGSINLRSKTKGLKIKSDMPYTAFWQANPTNPQFICIEPWYGLPDEVNTNHQLKDKLGIQKLEVNKTFITEIEISFIDEVKE